MTVFSAAARSLVTLVAVIGAYFMAPLRERFSTENIVRMCTLVTAVGLVITGLSRSIPLTCAALLFGAASALQTLAQTTGWTMPYQLPLAFPYVLTLVLLATARARTAAPAALGQRSA